MLKLRISKIVPTSSLFLGKNPESSSWWFETRWFETRRGTFQHANLLLKSPKKFYDTRGFSSAYLNKLDFKQLHLQWTSVKEKCQSLDHVCDLQEDIDNKSPLLWQGRQASCFHFELNEMEGSTHLGIPFAWRVLYRLAQIVYTGPEDCSIEQ